MTPQDTSRERHPSVRDGRDRIHKNVISSWAVYAIFVVTGFLMPRLIDRQLGQATLGVWDFGWSLVAYLSLTPLGVGSAVVRYVARYRTQQDRRAVSQMTASAFCVQFAAAALSISITIAVAAFITDTTDTSLAGPQARLVVLILGLSAATHVLFDVSRGVITGCHRWDIHNALNAGSHLVTVIVMASALFTGGTLVSLAFVTFGMALLTELVRTAIAYQICPDFSVDVRLAERGTIHQLLRFGLKSFLLDASVLILYQTTSLLIVHHLGAAALALFARPMALVRHATLIVNKYAFVLSPTASSLQADGRAQALSTLIVRTTEVATYLALPMILTLAILGDAILEVWMGASYRAGLILVVLAAGHLLPIVQEPLVSILTGTNAHGRAGLVLAVAAVLAGLFSTVMLTQTSWGLLGAALSITIPLTAAKGVYLPVSACRQLGLGYRSYLLAALLRPALHLTPLAIILLVCRWTFTDQPFHALGWGLISGGLVLLPTWWYHLLSNSLRARIVTHFGWPHRAEIDAPSRRGRRT